MNKVCTSGSKNPCAVLFFIFFVHLPARDTSILISLCAEGNFLMSSLASAILQAFRCK